MRRGNDLVDQDLGIDGVVVWLIVSSRGEVVDVLPQATLDAQKIDLIEGLVENFIAFLPEDKVGEGDSWIQVREEEGATPDDPPSLEGEVEYILDQFKKQDGMQVAKIIGEGKAKINAVTPGGLLTGKAKGDQEYILAVDGGYVVKSKTFMELSGEMGSGKKLSMVRRIECKLK